MRKLQSYVVSDKRVFVGLEDSKRTWKLCIRSEGMIVQEVSMEARYEHLKVYFQRSYPKCQIEVIYEAGFGGFWLHDLLTTDGIKCVVTPPCKVTEEKVKRVKTDKIDARRLAKVLETGDYVSCWVPDKKLREDRQVVRCLSQVQKEITATRNRIRKFLDFHGLNGHLPPGVWKEKQYDEVRLLELDGSLQFCLEVYFRQLDTFLDLKKELMSELRRIAKADRYRSSVKLKESCPGIAFLTAIRLTLELGDLSRFPDGKELGSYLGLTSSEYSSGDSIHRGKITRQGRGQLRAWMIESAWVAIRHDPVLLDKFSRIWRNSGRKKAAIVAVARKLAGRMLAVEKKQEVYQPGTVQ